MKSDSPEFVKNQVAMQDNYIKQIETDLAGRVRSVLPLSETEVRGVPMLERTASSLFGV